MKYDHERVARIGKILTRLKSLVDSDPEKVGSTLEELLESDSAFDAVLEGGSRKAAHVGRAAHSLGVTSEELQALMAVAVACRN